MGHRRWRPLPEAYSSRWRGGSFSRNFAKMFSIGKTRMIGLYHAEYRNVTDRRTDGRTDRIAISISCISIAVLTRYIIQVTDCCHREAARCFVASIVQYVERNLLLLVTSASDLPLRTNKLCSVILSSSWSSMLVEINIDSLMCGGVCSMHGGRS